MLTVLRLLRPRTDLPAFLEQHTATGRRVEVTGLLVETGPHASRQSSSEEPADKQWAAESLAVNGAQWSAREQGILQGS